MSAHARLGPSGADRWMVCTASVPLIDQLMANGEIKESDLEGEEQIDEETVIQFAEGAYSDVVFDPNNGSSFASEGTVMHEIRALCLSLGFEPHDFSGRTFWADGLPFEIDDDMSDRLVAGIDWIREQTPSPDVELRVDLSPWMPGQFGTLDTGFYRDGLLGISDYKNGIGKPVIAEGNRQLRFYAMGYWHHIGRPPVKRVLMMVDQPRVGGLKPWEITLEELLEFGEEARRVYNRIVKGDVEFVPTTSGCQFCPVKKAKRGCAAYNAWMLRMFGNGLFQIDSEPKFIDPAQMPRAQRYYIVRHAAAIKAWLTKLYEESLQAAISGDPDPGSKAVEGNAGRRVFKDEEAAKRILVGAVGRKAFKPRQIIGITEVEKLIKPGTRKEGHPKAWEALLKLVDQPEGRPKLVPAEHPKPAYTLYSEDDFDDLP